MPSAQVVIINVDTIALTALAALSALRYLPFNLRVIDCSKRARESKLCGELCNELNVHMESFPLRPHGITLDRLYSEKKTDVLIHLDSDAELLDGCYFLKAYKEFVNADRLYGIGWLEKGRAAEASVHSITWYRERPWLPFCAFKVRHVQRALNDDIGFLAELKIREFDFLPPLLRKVLAYRRHLWRFRRPESAIAPIKPKRTVETDYPYVYSDTGARLHEKMTALGYSLKMLDWGLRDRSVSHYHGATRNRLSALMPNSVNHKEASRDALQQIDNKYRGTISPQLFDRILVAAG